MICREQFSLMGASVGVSYAGSVRELILRLKFHRLRVAAEVAAELVVSGLPEDMRVDVVTAVPISPARYHERGYNQSELIGRRVAARLALPYASLLVRTNSAHQLGEDRRTRLEQVRGAFAASRRVDGLRVLAVDDVITTGATLNQCAEVLRQAGAEWIWGAVVARRMRDAGDLA
ncbi:MAG TPA: phosphoribosyltransferase family protein [Candidatus Saccharimonadia bacterium]|nr:phosphoribosyltransferase family protein [Candidatus Saccharimonadia bacterium]